jgi:phage tail sheath protein FI
MATPGIWNEPLTNHMIEVCESRGDALAVIDLKTGYFANTENNSSDGDNLGSVSTAITNLRNRKINSSYGTAYYPWVQIRDTISNSLLFVPPSIVALGTFSSAQKSSELWFAPAGFTRGGLTEGSAGLPVIQTRERLTSRDRDDLYEANINPIATFPAEGIVIFGQKTLQVTPSALDRINVRRLMIFIKREISRIAATTLFDQNVQATWNRFKGRADALLASVQARLGLTDYKIVLDSSTTTPELVDRNIMYAKIFLKPARAIEFIALDFVITNSGAGFED